MRTHGLIGTYNGGCHCPDCRDAARAYRRKYRRRAGVAPIDPVLDDESITLHAEAGPVNLEALNGPRRPRHFAIDNRPRDLTNPIDTTLTRSEYYRLIGNR